MTYSVQKNQRREKSEACKSNTDVAGSPASSHVVEWALTRPFNFYEARALRNNDDDDGALVMSSADTSKATTDFDSDLFDNALAPSLDWI